MPLPTVPLPGDDGLLDEGEETPVVEPGVWTSFSEMEEGQPAGALMYLGPDFRRETLNPRFGLWAQLVRKGEAFEWRFQNHSVEPPEVLASGLEAGGDRAANFAAVEKKLVEALGAFLSRMGVS